MAKKSREAIQKERERVLKVVQATERPQFYSDIQRVYAQHFGSPIAYVTLRARLDELVAAGVVGRQTRRRLPQYWAVEHGKNSESPSDPISTPPIESTGDIAIPLGDDAKAARALLQRHASARQPSTYDMDWLDDYQPNVTQYLPTELRNRLLELGRTAAADQPAGTYARDIMERLVIDLAWGSSRLEGNKYSRIDTEELIRAGRDADGASDRDRQMILNHKAAIEFLVESASEIAFNKFTVQSLHALLAENLLENREEEGQLRRRAVTIGTSLYIPTAIPQIIEERFETLLRKADAISDPIEQAFFAMVHLPYLQPFIDVNKRTSRLAANIPLVKSNLCPLSFVDVPEAVYTQGILAIYELRDVSLLRDVFAWGYQRSCQQFKVLREAMGEPDPIRLEYRLQLRSVVKAAVVAGVLPDERDISALATEMVIPQKDLTAFVRQARLDLLGLRPEVLARYGIRPAEYNEWRKRVKIQSA